MTDFGKVAKAAAVNPLKLSPALGGALAFLGIDRCLPMLHGGQGCTAFSLVLAVRHFRETIPLQTTAMSELSTILGGADNVEQAIATIYDRAHPRVIGICTTALTETRDDDISAELPFIVERHPEWQDLDVILASTPDYAGGLEVGWSRAVTAMVNALVEPAGRRRTLRRVNLLAGSHLSPGDVEELRETIEGFGLRVIVLPDLSGSLDGHVPDDFVPTSLGGTPADLIRGMGESVITLAIGEQMRPAAEALAERTGVPFTVFDRVTGLEAFDAFVAALMEVSGNGPNERLRRQRSRLVDAMLDGHFYFGGRKAAVAGDPDLALAMSGILADLGCTVARVVTTAATPAADRVPAESVMVGDLDDLERDLGPSPALIVASSHAKALSDRLGASLFRAGFPVYDRLGAPQRVSVGYRGTRDLVFALGNLLMEHDDAHPHPAGEDPGERESDGRHFDATLAAG
ncbi:MAG: nitrogenase iron-molybdenum cofactor biosynthesis protein NifN [Rhodospirillales bacterium]|nr:MAG: nitrogenase iron-molybdenum cofactor biosynthesis protein NifN [Rhodospirillales bacterium]